jgi:hypothetical protein
MAASFRDAVREALVATGRRVLLDSRAFVGAVTDLYDPLSAEVWVLRANCSAEMLQPMLRLLRAATPHATRPPPDLPIHTSATGVA